MYPKEITLVLTTRCNLRCKLCYQNDFTSDFDMKLLSKLTNVFSRVEWLHPIGGEPLLYDLSQIFSVSKKKQCKIKLITNATLITSQNAALLVEKIDRLIVSIDGGNASAYRAMRGSDLEKPLQGIGRVQIRKALRGRPLPVIEINTLLCRTTLDSLPQLALRAAILNVTCVNIFYPVFKDRKMQEREKITPAEARPFIDAASKHIQIIEPQYRGGEICKRPWNTCLIDIKGNVFGCCFGSSKFGNINEQTFEECWFGPAAEQLRATVNTENELSNCKRCCVRNPNG